MKYYLAPLEGITKLIYRNCFYKHFSNIDKMYIPFIEPTSARVLTVKEKKEMLPEKNMETFKILVPQIISKNAEDSIFLIQKAKELGYQEINLNFGCPSPTVTTKNKGSGILKDLDLMEKYLQDIFSNRSGIKISAKIRIGFYEESEFLKILDVLNKFDIHELIIHPRTGIEKYSGIPRLHLMDNLDKVTNIPIIYNGDIKSLKDIEYICHRFPYLKGIMLGRGLIARPFLFSNLKEEEIRTKLKEFYLDVVNQSVSEIGWGNAKFFAKEVWFIFQQSYIIPSNLAKKPFKQEQHDEFINVITHIMKKC